MTDGRKQLPYAIIVWVAVVMALAALGLFVWDVTHPAKPQPTPVTVVNEDAWVLRRIRACDEVCGPVPFEVEATRDAVRCTCGRPANLGRVKVPKVDGVLLER